MARTDLILDSVSYAYNAQIGVDKLSLSLAPGEITTLLGPSGAGKSTLLRLIAGMQAVHSGTIELAGHVLSTPHSHVPIERRKIGLIFQDFALFPHLTAAQNIQFGLHRLAPEKRRERADTWIQRLELTARGEAYPHQLSGGEQQRVALARALAPQPEAILLDEPFSGLDPSLRSEVRDTVLRAVRDANIPALMVTHDPVEALMHSDRLAIMSRGTLLQTGITDQVYRAPTSLTAMRALGPVQSLTRAHLPADWRNQVADAPQLYARPEAFCVDAQAEIKFEVQQIRLNAPLKEAHLAWQELRITALIPAHLNLQMGDTVGVRCLPEHIQSF